MNLNKYRVILIRTGWIVKSKWKIPFRISIVNYLNRIADKILNKQAVRNVLLNFLAKEEIEFKFSSIPSLNWVFYLLFLVTIRLFLQVPSLNCFSSHLTQFAHLNSSDSSHLIPSIPPLLSPSILLLLSQSNPSL